MINVAVIGYGYWGPNLVRNLIHSSQFKVEAVYDLNPQKLQSIKTIYPGITINKSFSQLIKDENIDAVVIATPISTHYELAKACLDAGKHVLVEKPLADSSKKCKELIEKANSKDLVLFVDHTFPFTEAVKKIRELIKSEILGEILYFDSTRINLGLFQYDSNVLWDLAIHDLSIIIYLFNEFPIQVSATGNSCINNHPVNMASLSLEFESNFYTHINVNWLSPVKVRQILIGGDKKMLLYDDIEPTEKLKLYDKGVDVFDDATISRMKYGYRSGDVNIPYIPQTEALINVVENFADCINGKASPLISATDALEIIKILECADISMKGGGKPIEINP
jgi:predicted dehydrogenase